MKCPCCGYNQKLEYNPSTNIQKLLNERTKATRKLIRKAGKLIKHNVPSDNNILTYFKFLQGISHIEDKLVRKGIEDYIFHKRFDNMYGFAYLGGIIRRMDTNAVKQLENEIKKYGKTPSIKEVIKKEYKDG
jgi:hypothetical protein